MPGVIVSATTASFSSVEKRRLRATPLITSTFENVSDIGTCLGLSLGPPAIAGVGRNGVQFTTAEKTEGHILELNMFPGTTFKVFEQKPREERETAERAIDV